MVLDESSDAMRGEAQSRTHALRQPLDIARFRGEAAIGARLVDGPTRDFNLMVQRDAARGTLDVWRDNGSHEVQAQTVLLYCAQGEQYVSVDGEPGAQLATGDTLRIDTQTSQRVLKIDTRGAGALLAIGLTRLAINSPESQR
ncbi:HutD family protein, partial [Paraburkholderia sp. J41]|uniref:HutD/Ves family protein n=1 Tax=Paraburkholderia sp. J41 TaxID=2805433 RepID=UPI002AC3650F